MIRVSSASAVESMKSVINLRNRVDQSEKKNCFFVNSGFLCYTIRFSVNKSTDTDLRSSRLALFDSDSLIPCMNVYDRSQSFIYWAVYDEFANQFLLTGWYEIKIFLWLPEDITVGEIRNNYWIFASFREKRKDPRTIRETGLESKEREKI